MPLDYWTHWDKLTSFPCREGVCPKYGQTFDELSRDLTFVRFANAIDKKYVALNYTVPGRLEMEALYTQLLLKKFDELPTTDLTNKARLRMMLREARESQIHPRR